MSRARRKAPAGLAVDRYPIAAPRIEAQLPAHDLPAISAAEIWHRAAVGSPLSIRTILRALVSAGRAVAIEGGGNGRIYRKAPPMARDSDLNEGVAERQTRADLYPTPFVSGSTPDAFTNQKTDERECAARKRHAVFSTGLVATPATAHGRRYTHAYLLHGKRADGLSDVAIVGFSESEYQAAKNMRSEIKRAPRARGVVEIVHSEIVTVRSA
jgi:hypothetical protein